jgi:hypothetical protein
LLIDSRTIPNSFRKIGSLTEFFIEKESRIRRHATNKMKKVFLDCKIQAGQFSSRISFQNFSNEDIRYTEISNEPYKNGEFKDINNIRREPGEIYDDEYFPI